MTDVSIAEVSASLDRLSKIGKALADAEKIVRGLQSAEQRQRELDNAIAARQAEILALDAQIADKEQAKADADHTVLEKIRAADEQAADVLKKAREDATGIRLVAEGERDTLKAEAVAAQETVAAARADLEAARAELLKVQARIAELTGKADRIEAAKAEAAEALEG